MIPLLVIFSVVAVLFFVGWLGLQIRPRAFPVPSLSQARNQPSVAYATWLDAGKPWAAFTLDVIKFNVDVSEYIRRRGN
jgi:hypothetical protein